MPIAAGRRRRHSRRRRLGRSSTPSIIVYGKLNPIIVTLATNFIGGAALFLVFQTIQVPLEIAAQRLRAQLPARPAEYLVADGDPGAGRRLLPAAHPLRPPRHRRRRQPLCGAGARHFAQEDPVRDVHRRRARSSGWPACSLPLRTDRSTRAPERTSSSPVIAAVILAGVSLAGGRGNVWMLLLSVGFLSTIPTSLVFFGFSSDWQAIFQGLILIIAVAIDG